ncbi:MAG: hypothetical protein H0T76_20230 [Nannocystis sp.]|nr:hypothetical protein [Nannocystis sp.]MBA3548817.1 hypothetical protein [Nannocystis sp.]
MNKKLAGKPVTLLRDGQIVGYYTFMRAHAAYPRFYLRAVSRNPIEKTDHALFQLDMETFEYPEIEWGHYHKGWVVRR